MARRPFQLSLRTLLLALGVAPAVIALLVTWGRDYLYGYVLGLAYFVAPVLFVGAAALFWRFLGSRGLFHSQDARRLGTIVFFFVVALSVCPWLMSPNAIRQATGRPTNSLWWLRMGVPCVWLELPSSWHHLVGFSVPEAKPRWIVAHGLVANLLIASAIAYVATVPSSGWLRRGRLGTKG